MSENKKYFLVFAVIITVLVIKNYAGTVNNFLYNDVNAPNFYLSVICQVLYYLVPTALIIMIFHEPRLVIVELGIQKNSLSALGYAFFFTLPMLIGYFIMGNFGGEDSIFRYMVFSFKDGFREEIFYRAFLFGQLFRHAKWKFLYAVFFNGLVFGLSHLYQAHDLMDSIGVFGITFAGAVWFAWLYKEWNYNLWLPIGMHFLMNFYWDIFHISNTAIGSFELNIPRVLTIAASVLFTIFSKRKLNHIKNKK